MSALPFVDRHSVEVDAPVEDLWRVVEKRFADRSPSAFARVLGCEDPSGFHVAERQPPARLVLAGRHRFSIYELAFTVEPLGDRRSRLSAETRAAFPGGRGRVYRALVIGSRGHVLAVRRMLASVAQACRGAAPR